MSRVDRELRELLELVLATAPEEIDCDEFLHRVAAAFEGTGAGSDLPPELDAVSQHLDVCPECREEYDALVRALGA
ncbi:MAG: hypothetical protein R3266_09100 [Gemmatimonadota bacterium]|nr:hypothetical protein [Gemmatimonadota bacterium]